jgi:hypothetical protein
MDTRPYEEFNAEHFYDEVLVELSRHPSEVLNLEPGPGHLAQVKSRLMNYASRAQQLDLILARLEAKHFCSTQCPRTPGGCCWEYAHRMGNEDFFEFLAVQEVEARAHGWQQPGRMCRYLMTEGCPMTLFKPPVCIRHMCAPLVDSLGARFGAQVRDLNNALMCVSQDVQRGDTILEELDRAIAVGKGILTLRQPDSM